MTGPSDSDGFEDCESPDQPGDQACRVPTDSVHRQCCCRDACGDAEKGPSDSDCMEDSGKRASTVRWQSYGRACDQAEEIMHQKRISKRVVGQIDDVPVPQILKEVVEVVTAVKKCPSGFFEQIDDDIVPVDQPGDQARCDTQAYGDAEKGPSDSDCLEDSGTPSDSESDLAESSEGSAEVAKRPRHWSSRHWGRRQGPRDGWSWARNSWSWRW